MRQEKINLFCIPFAGGSYYSYAEFPRYMADFINVIPIEPPGRGRRFAEPLLTDIHEIAHDLFSQIRDDLNRPYAIYGHSMGSWSGYLLVKHIIKEKMSRPAHLFVTGRGGPSIKKKELSRHQLPRKEFLKLLREFEGIPPEVLHNEELMDFFEPIIRTDLQANDTYIYKESEPFDVPITVMIGLDDRTTYEEALEWQRETSQEILPIQFPGGHFFIFQHVPEICRVISQRLGGVSLKKAG